MKRLRYTRLAAGLVLCLLGGLLWLFTARPAESARRAQEGLPTYGWEVCADNGIGPVPGLGENRQRFVLCHADGWQLQAYCLDPGVAAPPLGQICQSIGTDRYWCGDSVQRLAEYGVLATPGPTDTPTPTATYTATPTATATATVTATAKVVTATPTLTTTSTVTPIPSNTPQEQRIATSTPPVPERIEFTATPYRRPRPGGPGNANLVMGFGLGGLVLGSAGWAALRLRKAR